MQIPAPRGSRLKVLVLLAIAYLAVSVLLRLTLTGYEGSASLFAPAPLLKIFLIGLIYDLAAFAWIAIPFVLLALLFRDTPRARKAHAAMASALAVIGIGALVFGTVGELLFWNEFSARFNFIAVDYLVYTREVTGNIAQSYPLGLLISVALAVILGLSLLIVPFVWRAGLKPAPALRQRGAIAVCYPLILAGVFFGLTEGPHRLIQDAAARELAGNGHYALFRAFRNNDLEYDRFYATLPERQVDDVLKDELLEAGLDAKTTDAVNGFAHDVAADGDPARKNVVLVTIESLGADYVEAFGGAKGLTPNLSALANDSLTFTNLYATGLRTVRGLEAVTLSLPPTPGRAVPIRKNNKGLMSLGSVLAQNDYQPMYIYGGYSYFDNMRDFFGGNGYEVFDRTDIDDADIHHETIWGVADEDLFTFALKTIDKKAEGKKPFLAHIMTTSNHRPYTYPGGRIDIPSHSGRDGAVKYTDYAIGKFLAEARRKPWFEDTVFVFLADHTSHGRGRTDLPPENYRIPMWIYAPGFVVPGKVNVTASQIDVAPTVLGLLNIPYRSLFFGQDILRNGEGHQRAFMANYLTVGYMEDGIVVELAPQGRVRTVRANDGKPLPVDEPEARHVIDEAVSFYQTASREIERMTRP
ncbi:MAG: sulfatase-like hydrolase/transferase [Rhodospirillales bacterium]|nr:sulfatase-like hydrolase/transferase [Rhodospirillales bacterium]